MDKKYLYTAPAVRFLALSYEANFMTSPSGSIDDWTEDPDGLDF